MFKLIITLEFSKGVSKQLFINTICEFTDKTEEDDILLVEDYMDNVPESIFISLGINIFIELF